MMLRGVGPDSVHDGRMMSPLGLVWKAACEREGEGSELIVGWFWEGLGGSCGLLSGR